MKNKLYSIISVDDNNDKPVVKLELSSLNKDEAELALTEFQRYTKEYREYQFKIYEHRINQMKILGFEEKWEKSRIERALRWDKFHEQKFDNYSDESDATDELFETMIAEGLGDYGDDPLWDIEEDRITKEFENTPFVTTADSKTHNVDYQLEISNLEIN